MLGIGTSAYGGVILKHFQNVRKCYMDEVYHGVQIVYRESVYDCLNRDTGIFRYCQREIVFGVGGCITDIQKPG